MIRDKFDCFVGYTRFKPMAKMVKATAVKRFLQASSDGRITWASDTCNCPVATAAHVANLES